MVKKKRCPKCGINLPLEAYGRNRSRPDGLQVYCKDCRSTGGRPGNPNMRRDAVADLVHGAAAGMTDAEFKELYHNRELWRYIGKCANTKTKRSFLRGDLRTNAWLAVKAAGAGLSLARYKEIARQEISASYQRFFRRNKVLNDPLDSAMHYNEEWGWHQGYERDPKTPARFSPDGSDYDTNQISANQYESALMHGHDDYQKPLYRLFGTD